MADWYTKGVLTVIAVALSILAVRQVIPQAQAQAETSCGLSGARPCWVTGDVRVVNEVVVLPNSRIR